MDPSLFLTALWHATRDFLIGLAFLSICSSAIVAVWAIVRYRHICEEDEKRRRLMELNRLYEEPIDLAAEIRVIDKTRRGPVIVKTASGERLPL